MIQNENELLKTLSHAFPGMKDFDDKEIDELGNYLQRFSLAKGEALFQQGDPGDCMYIISRGCLAVFLENPDGQTQKIDVLDPGATVGEIALLTGQPRSAMVQGLVDTELISLSKAGLETLTEKHPHIGKKFIDEMVPRIQRTQLALAITRLLGPLDAQALHDLQRKVTWRHLVAGEVLIRQGEIGDTMYVVVNGRLTMTAKDDSFGTRSLGEINRGESVGEFALVSNQPRSATVSALRDTDVVGISREIYDSLIAKHPEFLRSMTRLIVERFRGLTLPSETKNHSVFTLAVRSIDPSIDFDEVVNQIQEALSNIGPTLHLNSRRFDDLFGKKGASMVSPEAPMDYSVTSWLNELENKYQFIIYEMDQDRTNWSERCLRQSDRVIHIVDGDRNPETLNEIKPAISGETRPDLEIVLIHSPEIDFPKNTKSFLKMGNYSTFHHVRKGSKSDFRRLTRRLTNRANCVVFSGGGARGFAQGGSIRAFHELELEIDMVGGTSIGALMGAAMAAGMSNERILNICKDFASPKRILDYTFPISALTASKKVSNIFKEIFGDLQIENLWTPFYCVSTNLTQSKPFVHREGPIWHAVRASTAIPGIFSPVSYQGDVLVDGGVMNVFPVDIMKEVSHDGFVIGVNCSPKKNKFAGFDFDTGISGWQILLQKILPFGRKQPIPSILANLMGASEVNGIYHREQLEEKADVIIKPPVMKFDTLDFGAYEELMEIGYHETLKELAGRKIPAV